MSDKSEHANPGREKENTLKGHIAGIDLLSLHPRVYSFSPRRRTYPFLPRGLMSMGLFVAKGEPLEQAWR